MQYVYIYADCNHTKPNLGVWSFLILNESGIKIHRDLGSVPNINSERIMLIALLEALKKVKQLPSTKTVFYIHPEFIHNILSKKWKVKKHKDLWESIFPLITDLYTFKSTSNTHNEWYISLVSSVTFKLFPVKFEIINRKNT